MTHCLKDVCSQMFASKYGAFLLKKEGPSDTHIPEDRE